MIILIITILLIIYGVMLLYFGYTWKKIPYHKNKNAVSSLNISIVIPARNEEKNLPPLLDALTSQSYPRHLYEIIVVDDHSTDQTAESALKYQGVTLLRLKEDQINSYKKKAIETGIASAKGELITTTDADCIPSKDWIRAISEFKLANNSVCIVAPVSMACNSSLLQVFQAMDFMMLQGITGAGIFRQKLSMSNGANFSYEKKVFDEVGGFKGIDSIASGDDMLLLHKISKMYPGRIHYLKSKDAIVKTEPMKTWREFFNQRIRWASKAAKYDDKRIFFVLLLVYLVNLCFPLLLIIGFWLP